MAQNQNEADVKIDLFTNENVLRRSAQSFTSMKILRTGRDVISKLFQENVQFPNVEKLCFHDGYFNDSVTRFATCFPTLKCLEFDQTTVQNRKCIEQYIPTLKQLTVFNNLLLENGQIFLVNNVRKAIQLNPQLEGIKFRCDAFQSNVFEVIQLLRFINEYLQRLNYLGIHFSVDNFNGLRRPIVFKNVTKAMLYVEAFNFIWIPNNINSPVKFEQLLELEMFSYDIYTDDCIYFAIKNQLLEKLKLEFHWFVEGNDEEHIIPDILYEDDQNNGQTTGNEGGDSGHSIEDDDVEEEDDVVEEEYDDVEEEDEDDEEIQYECSLEPFIKLTESLPHLKELSIGPITKFVGEYVVKILSAGKALNKLHIKLRYPLIHSPYTSYGVKKIEEEMSFIQTNFGDWSHQVEFKFSQKPDSQNKFRVANFVFERNGHST